jgi:ribosome modulation factor
MVKKISTEKKILRIYESGNASFYDGRKEEDCPYDGVEMSAWLMGWHDGQDDVLSDPEFVLNRTLGHLDETKW